MLGFLVSSLGLTRVHALLTRLLCYEPIIVSIGPVHQRVKVDQNLIIEGLRGQALQPIIINQASSEVKTRSEKQQTPSHDLCCVKKKVFDPNRFVNVQCLSMYKENRVNGIRL